MKFFRKNKGTVKISNIEITEEILRYVRKKKRTTEEELKKDLNLSSDDFKLAQFNLIDFSNGGKHFITLIQRDKVEGWEITKEGLSYLREIDLQHLQEQQAKFNRVIALTGSIIAFATLWNFMNNFLGSYTDRPLIKIELISFIIGVVIIFILAFLLGREVVGIYIKKHL